MSQIKQLAFIGIGMMGHGLSKNLLKQGYSLTFLDHPGNQPVDDLLEMGATKAATIAQTLAGAEVVFICVTGSPEVEAVMYGENGVLAHLSEGTIIVDASTAEPKSTAKVSAAVESAGGRYVDAPMTRTPKEAEEGRLNVLIGGDEEIIALVRPLIEAYAENIYVGGPAGSGHRLKLLHNYISLGTSVMLAEAYCVADKAGVDREVFTEVLASGGGQSVVLNRIIPFVESGDDSSFRFSISNAGKDLRYFTHMAEDEKVSVPVAGSMHQTLITAVNIGGENKSMPQLIDILAEINGNS
ncbi:MAG: NAD(P)-dependent oxidoreductase [Gammaproteobacteria bacterium]|nr:NAD(P)-dependent oxidoreductase [Gammaproteobacteria bacterium]